MIDTTESLRWALLIFTIVSGNNGTDAGALGSHRFFDREASCIAEGQRLLSLAEPTEGITVRFACVPRNVIRDDLAMWPSRRN